MTQLASVARAVAALFVAFVAGWFAQEVRVHGQLDRMEAQLSRSHEERDGAFSTARAAVALSDKALAHSVENAKVLDVCLSKLGFPSTPAAKAVLDDHPGFARRQP